MPSFVFLNDAIQTAANIPGACAAALYGKGVFTTTAIYDRDPFLWKKHWKRIEKDASKLGINRDEFSEATTLKALNDLIAANAVQNGRARITFFDESATALWPSESKLRTSMLIMTADFNPVPENFRLTISPHLINSTSPLAGVKSCNYLEKIIAKDDSKQRGFDEAIQLNQRGEISSACMANVFWLRKRKLFTPSLGAGCVPGTTREFVLENIDCEEVEAGIEELKTADEIFLTSAGIGMVQVSDSKDKNCRAMTTPSRSSCHPARKSTQKNTRNLANQVRPGLA